MLCVWIVILEPTKKKVKKDQAKSGNCRVGFPRGVLGELSAHLMGFSHAICSVGRCFSMNSWLSCNVVFLVVLIQIIKQNS